MSEILNSETPRTNANAFYLEHGEARRVGPFVRKEFCAQLEHELNLAAAAFVELAEQKQPLRHWQLEITEWASKTFPGQTPASKAKHLHNEAGELMDDPADGEEMADILILLLNLAEMGGINLLAEVQKKMVKNRARQWNAPDEHGVCKHVEGT